MTKADELRAKAQNQQRRQNRPVSAQSDAAYRAAIGAFAESAAARADLPSVRVETRLSDSAAAVPPMPDAAKEEAPSPAVPPSPASPVADLHREVATSSSPIADAVSVPALRVVEPTPVSTQATKTSIYPSAAAKVRLESIYKLGVAQSFVCEAALDDYLSRKTDQEIVADLRAKGFGRRRQR